MFNKFLLKVFGIEMIHCNNNFKIGLKIIFDDEPCLIEHSEFVKPGKGQVFTRVKLRKLLTNQLLEKTFRATDSFKIANIIDLDLCYLYKDNNFCYFMDHKSCDQFLVENTILIKQLKWLVQQKFYTVTFWNDKIISVALNNFIILKVIETEPGIKGDSISKNEKSAVLENGIIIKVPLFVSTNDLIKVDTRSSSYISRFKK